MCSRDRLSPCEVSGCWVKTDYTTGRMLEVADRPKFWILDKPFTSGSIWVFREPGQRSWQGWGPLQLWGQCMQSLTGGIRTTVRIFSVMCGTSDPHLYPGHVAFEMSSKKFNELLKFTENKTKFCFMVQNLICLRCALQEDARIFLWPSNRWIWMMLF